jgi:hypothetical protein
MSQGRMLPTTNCTSQNDWLSSAPMLMMEADSTKPYCRRVPTVAEKLDCR